MKKTAKVWSVAIVLLLISACKTEIKQEEIKSSQNSKLVTAEEILGNTNYMAISYGGYREATRTARIQPTLAEIKDDLRILSAMGIKVLRTYNVHFPHAFNILAAIRQMKEEDPDFEMYVMLGAWIDCKNAWTDQEPDHDVESEQNAGEIARAVALTREYSDIVKILAVGNEAMVKWATSYYVQPEVILKWVNHLQSLKKSGDLPQDLWITSSDDFASWGGGDPSYHTEDLEKLFRAVDFVSMHTYPYHYSHHQPEYWWVPAEEENLSDEQKIEKAMLRAKEKAISKYDSVANYMRSLGVNKPIHIGETGWASVSDGFYGPEGSRVTDEYKQALYYKHMRDWTNEAGMSCFYFEAFNEKWKDGKNSQGSENHFGLFTIDGKAKYPIWDLVDQGVFEGLTRNGNPVTKTYNGDQEALMKDVLAPPTREEHVMVQ